MLDLKQEVLDASNKIHPYIRETPLEFSINLSKITQAHVYLKCENFQHTGSFKVRGAFNKLLSLSSIERKQGIVAASSGNHGAAIAFGCNKLNIPGIVFVPENTSVAKIE
ncbi:MAG TPA: pyridoxal-phosphate dependent enzyme, partial [Gammaproteobacteria bacterium]|nr:pyridoxal-phosphate dependent enzyme [Gammaproteobacteria bacterium]